MKDEFTTLMHSELLGDEIPSEDLHVMAAYSQYIKGVPLEEACKNEGISMDFFLANVDRVMSS